VIWLLLSACVDVSCEDVLRAVEIRTLECTGDGELATARARRLQDEVACADEDAGKAIVTPACPKDVLDVPCEDVEDIGDEPRGWLDAAPRCADAFQ
jgi:hypothetical protein